MKLNVIHSIEENGDKNIKLFAEDILISEDGELQNDGNIVFATLGKINVKLLLKLPNIENKEVFDFFLDEVQGLTNPELSSIDIAITNGKITIYPGFNDNSLARITNWNPKFYLRYLRELVTYISFDLSDNDMGTDLDEDYLTFKYEKDFTKTIGEHLIDAMEATKKIISIANNRLAENFKYHNSDTWGNSAIEILFDFPEHLKIPCKQYLLYFSQFLSDIGIEASTQITEEAQKTLFQILPNDKNEAMHKIKEALEVYLNTPSILNFENEIMQSSTDIAAQQWMANVMHLKSQLILSQSIIQAKDVTIEALELNNYRYKQMLISQEKTNEKQEKILKGIVTIDEYKGKGFSINLAEILRMLKRKFGK